MNEVNLLLGVKSRGEEVGLKTGFKNRQRGGLSDVQRQVVPKFWSCNSKGTIPSELPLCFRLSQEQLIS